MSKIEKLIGAKITESRLSSGLTQAKLAEKINVSIETISRLERGVAIPSLRTIENIAFAIKIPLKNFFDIENNKPKSQSFERELSKLTAYLRTLRKNDIINIHKILKTVFHTIK